MRAVKVYGQLAKRVGQNVFRAEVASPAEAVRFLCANFPGLDEWLVDSAKDGIGYRVMVGRTKVGEEDFVMNCNDEATISITPVLCGAGGGGGTSVALGIGLIAVSFLFPGAGLFAGFSQAGAAGTFAGTLTTIGNAVSAIGASLAITGVAQMIVPTTQPLGNGLSTTTSAASDPRRLQSFNFSGVQNTSTQGTPINIVYGKMLVGSTTLSAGIFNANMV